MRRTLSIAVGGMFVLLAGLFGGAYLYVASPGEAGVSLAASTVRADSDRGRELLERSRHRADYDPLTAHFRPQIYRSYCGVASAVTVLRTTDTDARQETFFESTEGAPIGGWDAFFTGLTLRELGGLFESRDLSVEVRYAGETSVEAFRQTLRKNLGRRGDFLLVNYDRSTAGQVGGGHISPVAAYEEQSDRVLVLDTADFKYPPHWIAVDRLFRAMNTMDTASGRTRGYIVVRP